MVNLSLSCIFVKTLTVLFGIGSWIAINGLWVELPLLVQDLPEKWNLASYLAVIIQIANIGPISYSIARTLCGRKSLEISTVHFMMTIGVVACLLLGFFWSKTLYFGGANHSIMLLVLVFFLSLVDCTSSVVFLPFMAHFKEQYLTPFLIGEGMSGFLPSLVALGQGVGGNPECRNVSFNNTNFENMTYKMVPYRTPPNFPPEDFFFFLMGMMIVSWAAFTLLNVLPVAKNEMDSYSAEKNNVIASQSVNVSILTSQEEDTPENVNNRVGCEDISCHLSDYEACAPVCGTSTYLMSQTEASHPKTELTQTTVADYRSQKHLSYLKRREIIIFLLILQGWACILSNGVFPAIQPFSCLPYGDKSYHLVVTLSSMANPVACFIAMFCKIQCLKGVSLLSVMGTVVSCYVMATAVLSPEPPLMNSVSGELLVKWDANQRTSAPQSGMLTTQQHYSISKRSVKKN
ncbi:solute carrier family 52, riboflavin transporter, member 3-B-like isoform X2 [Limulus polyphemus]|uniref:Riboflavin transporter n=1 Tax=Limulus polyphemus TaxID=6850 RepID=A0ABM1T972_LIMPO|nr:solute carrier family 52, riboflavin transporter, member 3-B-like isoform X2 [Limulus polyphemus]